MNRSPLPAPARAEFTPGDLGRALGELARETAAQVADDFGRPGYRAGFGASVLTAALLARTRLPGTIVILTSVLIGVTVEHLYEMAEDVHGKITGPQLVFHLGDDCPGHSTGLPGESCVTGETR